MIRTLRPNGAISEALIQHKYQDKDKYYVVDDLFNRIEITKDDYNKLNCPIKKPKEARRF